MNVINYSSMNIVIVIINNFFLLFSVSNVSDVICEEVQSFTTELAFYVSQCYDVITLTVISMPVM